MPAHRLWWGAWSCSPLARLCRRSWWTASREQRPQAPTGPSPVSSRSPGHALANWRPISQPWTLDQERRETGDGGNPETQADDQARRQGEGGSAGSRSGGPLRRRGSPAGLRAVPGARRGARPRARRLDPGRTRAARRRVTARPRGMKPSTVSAACASAAIAFGAAALVGWWLDIDLLRRGAPGRVTMNPVTAVVLIVAGAALLLSAEPDRPPPARRLAQGLAALVVLVGGARLGAYLSAWNVPLDGLLFPARVAAVGSRLAQLAALNFVLTGLALALLRLEGRRVHAVLQTLLLGSGLTTLAALLGHLYGADMLHGPMALNTSLAFLALTTGALFARPDEGLVALLRGDTPAGALVRRLLPAVVLIPVVLGWLRLLGQKAGLYETEGGSALFVVTTIVALAGLPWWSSRSIVRADARRREVEGALRGSEGRFRALAASANDAIVSADAAGLITYFNPAAERIFEYGASELEGRPITMLMPDRYHDAHLAGLAR